MSRRFLSEFDRIERIEVHVLSDRSLDSNFHCKVGLLMKFVWLSIDDDSDMYICCSNSVALTTITGTGR